MKRRSFLKTLGIAAGIATAASPIVPGPAIAQNKFKWKMVTLWPRNFPGLGTASQRIANAVEEMSDGRLIIKVYGAGELVPAYEAFDAVREGIAECMHEAPYIWVAKHPAMAFFCGMSGGLTPLEHNAWIYNGGGQKLWDELYSNYGLKGFLAGNSGTNMGGWFNREINSVEDFDGLRMRIPGLGAEVLNRLGAVTMNIPGSEIVPALQTGLVDAAEWIAPYADMANGLHKVAKYYYGPSILEPGPANPLTVNLDAFNELPSDLKSIVEQASGNEVARMTAEVDFGNANSFHALANELNIEIRQFPQDVSQKFFDISQKVVAEVAEKDEISGRIYESWNSFRFKSIAHSRFSTHGFMFERNIHNQNI